MVVGFERVAKNGCMNVSGYLAGKEPKDGCRSIGARVLGVHVDRVGSLVGSKPGINVLFRLGP